MHHIKFVWWMIAIIQHCDITRLADTFHVALRASILDIDQFLDSTE